MKRKKERVDVLLVEMGLVETRTKAQALLLAGRVYVGEQRIDKPGTQISVDSALEVKGTDNPFVSRGGLKLQGALDDLAPLGLDPKECVCVDVGASTGGFTDCLLQHGATKVYAVDVGHGQLHMKLRDDPRVVVMERTNARQLDHTSFAEPIDLVVVDASFIGLEVLAPALCAMLKPSGKLCALVKPQFEAGREVVSKTRGVVRDPVARKEAIEKAITALVECGFSIMGGSDCRVAGPRGNVEYFALATKSSVAANSA